MPFSAQKAQYLADKNSVKWAGFTAIENMENQKICAGFATVDGFWTVKMGERASKMTVSVEGPNKNTKIEWDRILQLRKVRKRIARKIRNKVISEKMENPWPFITEGVGDRRVDSLFKRLIDSTEFTSSIKVRGRRLEIDFDQFMAKNGVERAKIMDELNPRGTRCRGVIRMQTIPEEDESWSQKLHMIDADTQTDETEKMKLELDQGAISPVVSAILGPRRPNGFRATPKSEKEFKMMFELMNLTGTDLPGLGIRTAEIRNSERDEMHCACMSEILCDTRYVCKCNDEEWCMKNACKMCCVCSIPLRVRVDMNNKIQGLRERIRDLLKEREEGRTIQTQTTRRREEGRDKPKEQRNWIPLDKELDACASQITDRVTVRGEDHKGDTMSLVEKTIWKVGLIGQKLRKVRESYEKTQDKDEEKLKGQQGMQLIEPTEERDMSERIDIRLPYPESGREELRMARALHGDERTAIGRATGERTLIGRELTVAEPDVTDDGRAGKRTEKISPEEKRMDEKVARVNFEKKIKKLLFFPHGRTNLARKKKRKTTIEDIKVSDSDCKASIVKLKNSMINEIVSRIGPEKGSEEVKNLVKEYVESLLKECRVYYPKEVREKLVTPGYPIDRDSELLGFLKNLGEEKNRELKLRKNLIKKARKMPTRANKHKKSNKSPAKGQKSESKGPKKEKSEKQKNRFGPGWGGNIRAKRGKPRRHDRRNPKRGGSAKRTPRGTKNTRGCTTASARGDWGGRDTEFNQK